MKKALIIASLTLFVIGCTVLKPVTVGMPEEQFIKEHPRSLVVEMSTYRTVYKDVPYNIKDTTTKFYYFSKGKLMLMDEGFYPRGSSVPVPTPL
ncbi:hypothetical protein LJ707_05390 [Mucilaginibacter sp. UR6-1]|uniref:hypothetical protein n=1 Tax=Mucilaginibacter sp. UR6-1 TaxID=1435643 RepID=UPI001E37DD88|nr:hypothetical protein [Mucilaginibacter sp. UR6-1]MCC8408353.1 hypothetical protein [Mucilaginibacter sp. UR6-1]